MCHLKVLEPWVDVAITSFASKWPQLVQLQGLETACGLHCFSHILALVLLGDNSPLAHHAT
jgi:hypothetical protein